MWNSVKYLRPEIIAASVAAIMITAAPSGTALSEKTPPTGDPVAVSLGDSFISGEAGRWFGNTAPGSDAWAKTDRGRGSYTVDRKDTDESGVNMCHRSDIAEIISARFDSAGISPVNVACSGATTENVLSHKNGNPDNREIPQASQLRELAGKRKVKLVVLSIGGNDLEFSGVVGQCATRFLFGATWFHPSCADDQKLKDSVDRRMSALPGQVADVITDIKTQLEAEGYRYRSGDPTTDYRFILQSYANPLPLGDCKTGSAGCVGDGRHYRYKEGDRTAKLGTWRREYGCPFYDRDSTWAAGLGPQISRILREAAAAQGLEFLDLQNVLVGHELCSSKTDPVTSSSVPDGRYSEWVRFVSYQVATNAQQSARRESLHPNAFGQQAQGECLRKMWAASRGDYGCTGMKAITPDKVALEPLVARSN